MGITVIGPNSLQRYLNNVTLHINQNIMQQIDVCCSSQPLIVSDLVSYVLIIISVYQVRTCMNT